MLYLCNVFFSFNNVYLFLFTTSCFCHDCYIKYFFPFIFNLKCLNEGKAFWYSFNTCSRNLRHFVPSWLQKLGKKESGSIVKKKKKKEAAKCKVFFLWFCF